jgi:hypothetical protein
MQPFTPLYPLDKTALQPAVALYPLDKTVPQYGGAFCPLDKAVSYLKVSPPQPPGTGSGWVLGVLAAAYVKRTSGWPRSLYFSRAGSCLHLIKMKYHGTLARYTLYYFSTIGCY